MRELTEVEYWEAQLIAAGHGVIEDDERTVSYEAIRDAELAHDDDDETVDDNIADWGLSSTRHGYDEGCQYSKVSNRKGWAYRKLKEAYAAEDIRRCTEFDVIAAMIFGVQRYWKSYGKTPFVGTDTAAYSKPTRTERQRLANSGLKVCSGVGKHPCSRGIDGTNVHSLSMFYLNKASADGRDNLCIQCRREQNRIDYQERKRRKAG